MSLILLGWIVFAVSVVVHSFSTPVSLYIMGMAGGVFLASAIKGIL